MTAPALRPLTVVAPYALWTVRDLFDPAARVVDELVQHGAGVYRPVEEVVPTLLAVHAVCRRPAAEWPELVAPVAKGPLRPVLDRRTQGDRPAGALARALWCYWPEVMPRATRPLPGLPLPPVTRRNVGCAWEVWDAPGGLDAAFRVFDHKGRAVPIYDVDRRPVADVVEALTTPAALAVLFGM